MSYQLSFSFSRLARAVFFTLLLCVSLQAWAASGIAGYWKIIDDKTHLPTGVVHVYPMHGRYVGRIIKTYPAPGAKHKKPAICHACQGVLRNHPVVGLPILSVSVTGKKGVAQGHVLDPHNGKTYRSTLTLIDGGQALNVRGYLGVSLFGRTQIWRRAAHP